MNGGREGRAVVRGGRGAVERGEEDRGAIEQDAGGGAVSALQPVRQRALARTKTSSARARSSGRAVR
ncbi:hypothetical protein GCM10010230_37140 [Streptomyces narbonensis]|nr:hypothetical protein GCM10010230_37140 [Streptomyces narbonensis]